MQIVHEICRRQLSQPVQSSPILAHKYLSRLIYFHRHSEKKGFSPLIETREYGTPLDWRVHRVLIMQLRANAPR
jgi:hypothetical protein